jgi:hypothetical protein
MVGDALMARAADRTASEPLTYRRRVCRELAVTDILHAVFEALRDFGDKAFNPGSERREFIAQRIDIECLDAARDVTGTQPDADSNPVIAQKL